MLAESTPDPFFFLRAVANMVNNGTSNPFVVLIPKLKNKYGETTWNGRFYILTPSGFGEIKARGMSGLAAELRSQNLIQ